jgi:O-acetyl-ADP-ribose deacetylase (regulator of RNase III)
MICLSKGDITDFTCDAIVNAGNESLLGCFTPGHKCLDHQIHQKAGPKLTKACQSIMKGADALPGSAIITPSYDLANCTYVIHAYGPNLNLDVFQHDHNKAQDCLRETYTKCLDLAKAHHLRHVAFPALSTGMYRFNAKEGAEIAIQTTRDWLQQIQYPLRVSFVMFEDNHELYSNYFASAAWNEKLVV